MFRQCATCGTFDDEAQMVGDSRYTLDEVGNLEKEIIYRHAFPCDVDRVAIDHSRWRS